MCVVMSYLSFPITLKLAVLNFLVFSFSQYLLHVGVTVKSEVA